MSADYYKGWMQKTKKPGGNFLPAPVLYSAVGFTAQSSYKGIILLIRPPAHHHFLRFQKQEVLL